LEIFCGIKCITLQNKPKPSGKFKDILGNDILDMVEETWIKGRVSGALNATFLALIPKSEKAVSFWGLDLLPYTIWCIRSSLRLLLLELNLVCRSESLRNNLASLMEEKLRMLLVYYRKFYTVSR